MWNKFLETNQSNNNLVHVPTALPSVLSPSAGGCKYTSNRALSLEGITIVLKTFGVANSLNEVICRVHALKRIVNQPHSFVLWPDYTG